MVFLKVCLVVAFVALTSASPAKPAFWKGTPLDSTVEEMRSACNNDDTLSCVKFKFMSFLDNIFKKDTFKISDDVEVTRNEFRANDVSARGEKSVEDKVQEYIQSHDVTFKLPFESQVTLGARNIDSDELNLKLDFAESRGKKSKLKKIIVPIMVFILLKAITLIPLALGVLGLKAWNALQLSFFSFVISVALAIFQLCKKIAADNTHPQITAHGPWDSAYSARSFEGAQPSADFAQEMAYNAYY